MAESNPALTHSVEEHRVEDVPGGGVEAEADVGHAKRRVHAGQLLLDAANRVDRGHGVLAQVVVAGGQREGERIEDQVGGLQPVAVDRQVVDAVGDRHLPVDIAGLAFLVDQQADHCGAVLTGQLHHPVEA